MAKPAIDFERIMDKPLGELKASDFLAAVAQAKLNPSQLTIIADKKKYELWVEETQIEKIPIRVIIEKIRVEKKKLELEPIFDFSDRVNPVLYERLVEDVAKRVEGRLGR